ncbi:MAG TPA: TIGR03557 family F420-dependent LLM class oxidoreductase [Candidatus Limnocylindrales bacterium]
MPSFGFALSSEEHGPKDLVESARRAEDAGFEFIGISDHYHPWLDRQGHSAFVWSVLGAIAASTRRIRIGTGVTCPTTRIHPAIIAQAAATVGGLMPGRFFLGVGTGENLNEHILGDRWPEYEVRAEMLEEAIGVIRQLWQGGVQSHHGRHYTVENARVYDIPDPLPEIVVAAAGPKSTELAARVGDGFWSTSPQRELVEQFDKASGGGKPKYAQTTFCWATDEAAARRTAHEWWANAAIRGAASQELPSPKHFEQLAQSVTEDQVAESIVCGPDPKPYLDQIRSYLDAGFDHVYFHQVGPDQAGFIDFAARELLPALGERRQSAA